MPWERELLKFVDQISTFKEGIAVANQNRRDSENSSDDSNFIDQLSAVAKGIDTAKRNRESAENNSGPSVDEERLMFPLPHVQSSPNISIPVHIFTNLPLSADFLGRGSYGDVYRYTDEYSRYSVAIKRINIPTNGASKEVSEVRKEVGTNERLRHDNITQFIGSCEIQNSLFILMEYMQHGSLRGRLNAIRESGRLVDRHPALNNDLIMKYIGDIVSGLVYLHLNKIVHRDLRAANVLLTGDEEVAKIADFGISKELNSLSTQTGFSSVVGNTYWRSPELIQNQMDRVGRKVDVWSLGITILEMIHVTPPFMVKYEPTAYMFALYTQGKSVIQIPDFVANDIQDVLKKCLIVEVEERPHSKDLLSWNE